MIFNCIQKVSIASSPIRPIVFCGPSGSGKHTLLKRLINEYRDMFAFSISHTTRLPHESEQNGREYYFVTREEMIKLIDQDEFLEHTQFFGNMYGTSKKAVQDVLSSGRVCVLIVDINGVQNLIKTSLNPMFVFIKPPRLDELEQRLRKRGTETEESLQMRLNIAKTELDYVKTEKSIFDAIIVNDNLESAYLELKKFIDETVIAHLEK
jgi:guanylate kinase